MSSVLMIAQSAMQQNAREIGMDEKMRTELEAAAFRTLVDHFCKSTDVQNLDLMNLAGFCRNCLAKWYLAAAEERGVAMNLDEAKQTVYGMPYNEWKRKYQREPSSKQKGDASQQHQH